MLIAAELYSLIFNYEVHLYDDLLFTVLDKLNELHDELIGKERRGAQFTEVN